MVRVVVVGGGLSGCGAAIAAAKTGAEVVLVERTDMLMGVAVRSGSANHNGRYTGRHELGFLGGGEVFDALESVALHKNIVWPDMQSHAYIFNTGLAEPLIRAVVKKAGVKAMLESRVVRVERKGQRILSVKLRDGSRIAGEAFVDCTGGRGGIKVCTQYGQGCVYCLVRCFAFGDRLGLVEAAGGTVYDRVRPDGTPGFLSAAMSVFKDTLSPQLKARIEKGELVIIPLPKELVDYSKLRTMGADRSKEFAENIMLIDTGPVAKLTGVVYMSLEKLRTVPGFENVQMDDPRYPKYNHVEGVGLAKCDGSMKVDDFENLFCAGDKAGFGGVNEAIMSGYVAGHQAARRAAGRGPLVLPRSLAIGDWLAYTAEKRQTHEGRSHSYRMGRGEVWERMKSRGLYTPDVDRIRARVEEAGMTGILSSRVVGVNP